MKIISYNVNGIRSAMSKGFVDWLKVTNPDIIGLQEVKADLLQIDAAIFRDLGYELVWHSALKKGYSGVAIFSKIKIKTIKYGMGLSKYDDEGRVLQADFDGFSFISSYFPSGTTGDVRQSFKYEFLDDFYGYLQDLRRENKKIILSGDYNICHKEIDIHNPVSNKNSSGFLPEERAWMDKFTESGFIDSFRTFNKDPHHYTWWSYRFNCRAKNLGWRIDYHMVTKELLNNIKSSVILPNVIHSDHCPILLEIS
jgi:exodeoxyribonuclease III